jgi:hypothetical protein
MRFVFQKALGAEEVISCHGVVAITPPNCATKLSGSSIELGTARKRQLNSVKPTLEMLKQ